MRVLISAGGTGGHIYPALSIIKKIKEMDPKSEFLYIGTTDRMEKDIIPNLGIDYIGIKTSGMSKNPIKLMKACNNLLKGINKCKKIIKSFKPDIVLGVGGYVTAPVIYSAHKLGIPTILHEQNSIPGKANKFLTKYASTICVSLPHSLEYFPEYKTVLTGNPRGEEIIKSEKANKKDYDLDASKKLILITTGSLGSTSVNQKILDLIPLFEKKSYEVLFVTGKDSYEEIRKIKCPNNVKIVPYLDNMGGVLKISDLIISRAGATIISEITALGLPSILIPSPYVPNNHQYFNAKELLDHKACILIEEKDLTTDLIINEIDKVLNNPILYKEMVNNNKKVGIDDGATKIYKEIIKLIKE